MSKPREFEPPHHTTSSEYRDLYNAYKQVCEERDNYQYKLECLLCHVTGNKMSYATYKLEDMYAVFNEQRGHDIDEAIREVTEELNTLRNEFDEDFEEACEELEEQARLNGMGAERELKLLIKLNIAVDALETYKKVIMNEYGKLVYDKWFDFAEEALIKIRGEKC